MTLNSNQQGAEFIPVYDGRKRKVQSLWLRADTFYARLKIAHPDEDEAKVRRIPLKANTVTEAVRELRAIQVKRDKGQSVVRERTPTLRDYAGRYIERLREGNRKRPKTISSEVGHLNFWIGQMGARRLHKMAEATG